METRQIATSKIIKSIWLKKPDEVSFRKYLVKIFDATKTINQFAGSKLKLDIELNKVLLIWKQKVKLKYKSKVLIPNSYFMKEGILWNLT